jgi:hypothetical protein
MRGRGLQSLLFVMLVASSAAAQEQAMLAPPVVDTAPAYSPSTGWIDAEALLWWTKGAHLPPLVTASPPGTAPGNVGVLGTPGTITLFGGSNDSRGMTPGGRLTAGYWLDCEQTCAIEAYYFQLGSQATHFSAGSPGNFGRPFFNAATGLPDAQLVSVPGILDGTVLVAASSSSLLGAGVLGRCNVCNDCRSRLDALVGYRYLSLQDQVGVSENLTSTDPAQIAAPLGTNVIVQDRFRTTNQFHGADIGLAGEIRWNKWSLGATARVALGCTNERVEINGVSTITVPGFAPVTSPGGLLALSSNSGTHTRDRFAVVPEARLRLAYEVGPRVSILAGYTFLYWSRVARAGDQIDLAVNPALLPPGTPGAIPQRPAFQFHDTSFWAQGINAGLEFRF